MRQKKSLVAFLVFPLLFAACAVPKAERKTGSAFESTSASRTYAGVLPCPLDCKNIRTELTLFDQGRRFTMKETVIGSAVGELVIDSAGEWGVLTGHGKNPKATVLELTSEQFEQERYFLKVDDNTLRALDSQGKDIATSQNVTLLRVKR